MKKIIIIFSCIFTLGIIACNEDDSENSSITPDDNTSGEIPFVRVPNSYTEVIAQAGTIEPLTYSTQNEEGNIINKTANVYLPYQYDSNQQFDILYLMHGGGGNNSTLIGNSNHSTTLKYVFDNMIYNGDIRPVIIVTPSFYNGGSNSMAEANALTHAFQDELREYLIPTVESIYSTYANSTTEEDLINSRNHRLFSGFSMGSVTTWYTLAENLDYFRYFIPASGDSWAIQQMGGSERPEETATYLANAIEAQGYSSDDFFVFAVTGTEDIAYEHLTNQVEAMRSLSDDFIYNSTPENGNLYYLEVENGLHTYGWYNDYLYNILPYFFSNTEE